MQQQTTPDMNDENFSIPKFYEVGQMKDEFCLWGQISDYSIIMTATQQLNPRTRLSNNNSI